MKSLIVICVLFTFAYAQTKEEMLQYAKMVHSECAGETGVAEADVAALKSGTMADNKEIKCFVGCMANKFGMITDGAFDRAKTEANILKHTSGDHQAALLGFLDRCSAVATSTDLCETGGQLFACLKEQGALDEGILCLD